MLVDDDIEYMNEMEEDGREFYEFASMNTNNVDASNVFNALGKEELIHKEVFTKMKDSAPDSKDITGDAEEHINFLNEHFSSRHVFFVIANHESLILLGFMANNRSFLFLKVAIDSSLQNKYFRRKTWLL